jgi:ribosomal protein S20
MTKKANSAREIVEKFGGFVPDHILKDLEDSVLSGVFTLFAKTWTERVEAEISSKKLLATSPALQEFFGALDRFEEAKKMLMKHGKAKRRKAFREAYCDLLNSANTLGIDKAIRVV